MRFLVTLAACVLAVPAFAGEPMDYRGFTLGYSAVQSIDERSQRIALGGFLLRFSYESATDTKTDEVLRRYGLGFGFCPGCHGIVDGRKTMEITPYLVFDAINITSWDSGIKAYTPALEIGAQMWLTSGFAIALGARGLASTRDFKKESQTSILGTIAYSPL